MLKRIILDVDNTLIMWKDKYLMAINHALDKINYAYDYELIVTVNNAIGEYEKYHHKYDKNNMLSLMNKYLKEPLPESFFDIWIEEQAAITDVDQERIDVLEYLHNKYELVVLSNWFTVSQTKRLETAGLLKYITKVYAADTFLIKPNSEGFIKAMNGLSANECIMIGDNIKSDIKPALDLGMQVIYFNYNHKKMDNNYPTITEFRQLKDIL